MKSLTKIVSGFAVLVSAILIYKNLFLPSSEIILNGNVEIQSVNISFRTGGRVSNVKIEEGAHVKKGDTLATIDSDILDASLLLAKASFNKAELHMQNCKKDFERNNFLLAKKSISEKIFDDISMQYKTSCLEREIAVANYKIAHIGVQDTILKSPVDGIVLTRNIEVGEMIGVGLPAFSVMPNTTTKIKIFANEETLAKIKHNDTVYVSIASQPEKKFKGHIGYISSEAEFTPKNIETNDLRTSLVYRIRVIIDEDAPELKHGMPVSVRY